jgi:hypothetical protein
VAVLNAFSQIREFYGFDINPQYVSELKKTIHLQGNNSGHIECRDFFQVDWDTVLGDLDERLLIVGNPPWVTNSAIGTLGGSNLPFKTNFQKHNGFAAKTGKANFDISEWMLIRLLEALDQRPACLAMLCKTSTARKTLRHAWRNELNIGQCSLHVIDAQKHFGASVDACLLIIHTGAVQKCPAIANVYADLSFQKQCSRLGFAEGELVADIDAYLRLQNINGVSCRTWRSGVKHDAASVMEFKQHGEHYVNGMREECNLEPTYLFPLLKSSDIANGRLIPTRLALLTQQKPSDDTSIIENAAPKTWQYLMQHFAVLDERRSIIYKNRPRFSVFGVGDYTFASWKVAISGLYKNCRFSVVGPHHEKPVVMDDTCYFVACASEIEARFLCELLNSDVCQNFVRSLVFFDSKRPITIDVLNRIDLRQVANLLNRQEESQEFFGVAADTEEHQQLLWDFGKKDVCRTKLGDVRRVSRSR